MGSPGWVIFIWLILFYPVGLFFLVKKLRSSVTAARGMVLFIGWVFLILGINMIGEKLFPSIICIAICFFAFVSSRIMKAKIRFYEKYYHYVVNQKLYKISSIATYTNTSLSETKVGLQKLIQKGYLQNYYIDNVNEAILLKGTFFPMSVKTSYKAEEEKYDLIVCPGCSARNKVRVGDVSECIYCRTVIKA